MIIFEKYKQWADVIFFYVFYVMYGVFKINFFFLILAKLTFDVLATYFVFYHLNDNKIKWWPMKFLLQNLPFLINKKLFIQSLCFLVVVLLKLANFFVFKSESFQLGFLQTSWNKQDLWVTPKCTQQFSDRKYKQRQLF